MLTNILSAKHRKLAYAIYALFGLVIGAIQVGFMAAEAGQPTWLTVTLAVFGFLGTGLGLTAAANTHTGTPAIDTQVAQLVEQNRRFPGEIRDAIQQGLNAANRGRRNETGAIGVQYAVVLLILAALVAVCAGQALQLLLHR